MTRSATQGGTGAVMLEAEALLFGFEPTAVVVSIRPRSVGWRVGRSAQVLGVFLVVSPIVAIVPPHAPWAIGALALGVILARRRWTERFTLEAVRGACPKCGAALRVKAARLKTPHRVSCERCHHESSLRIQPALLRRFA